jgi:hypothetical protein
MHCRAVNDLKFASCFDRLSAAATGEDGFPLKHKHEALIVSLFA